MTKYNENGSVSLISEKKNSKVYYRVFNSKTEQIKLIESQWLRDHKLEFLNVSITSKGIIKHKKDISEMILNYWNYYTGYSTQGKMTISKVLNETDTFDLLGLRRKKYDGIVIYDAPVGIKEQKIIKYEFIAFYPDQIKDVNNIMPMVDKDIYGVRKLIENSELSNFQEIYFRRSVVRNKLGELMPCYHCTNAKFDSFNDDYVGMGGGASYGKGFYFSSEPLKEYGNVMTVYLKICSPYVIKNVNSFDEVLHFLLENIKV